MKETFYIFLFFYVFFPSACYKDKSINGFDSQSWKKDKYGCSEKRITLASYIITSKNKWMGMDDDDLIFLLGKPEQSFYYERNAKSFAWYIQPGTHCPNYSGAAKKLMVDINATGFVNLIRIVVE